MSKVCDPKKSKKITIFKRKSCHAQSTVSQEGAKILLVLLAAILNISVQWLDKACFFVWFGLCLLLLERANRQPWLLSACHACNGRQLLLQAGKTAYMTQRRGEHRSILTLDLSSNGMCKIWQRSHILFYFLNRV